MPRISIVMPVFNAERFIRKSLDSILKQTYEDYEVIIINDGSSDGTSILLEEYYTKDNRVKVYHQENKGIIESLNRGLNLAEGEYIARMDSDDICDSNRLEKQYHYMQANNLDICGCHYFEIDEEDRLLGLRLVPTTPEVIKMSLCSSVPFAHPTVMMRKSFLRNHSLIYGNGKHKNAEDLALWVQCDQLNAKFGNVDEILFKYRINSLSLSRVKRKQILSDSASLFNEHFIRNRTLMLLFLKKGEQVVHKHELIYVCSLVIKNIIKKGDFRYIHWLKKIPTLLLIKLLMSELNKILKV